VIASPGPSVTDPGAEISTLPLIVSVDDHVVEPSALWSDRLPASKRSAGPRVVRERVPSIVRADEGKWADVWYYESVRVEVQRGFAAVGFAASDLDAEAMTFDEMRPGAFDVTARLADMDTDGVEASVCFPNAFVRFCGQRFLEAEDHNLALECVKIYNDWLIEDWAGPSQGRLVPSAVIPLWDSRLAADEVRRNAGRGCRAVCFSEIPARLGLPSMYSGYWDPFFAACEETGTVINLHIGSSSVVHTTSADAPQGIKITNHFSNSAFSLSDWLISGAFIRFPELRVAFSEGQAGWIPYLLNRLDGMWSRGANFVGFNDLPDCPSSYFRDHVFACVFDDPAAMLLIEQIGEDNICFETDYPHNDSTWPHSGDTARALTAGLSAQQRAKILRLNGARLYNIDRILRPLEGEARWATSKARQRS
jgi:predicted TIM-barrel fold metal-dependent hydrolase